MKTSVVDGLFLFYAATPDFILPGAKTLAAARRVELMHCSYEVLKISFL